MVNKSSPVQKKFGERVRKIRIKVGISQEQLGFETGLDRTYISGIERGTRNPTLKIISKIAKALKVSASDLMK